MSATLMFWPMLAMAALTAAAWAIMGRRRLAAVRARDMRLGDFSGTSEIAMSPAVSVSTRHFANHFEVPVLFQVICLAHVALAAVSWLALGAAWLFVVLRALHMREHLGRNDIMTRFNLYAGSTALVWLLWLHLAGALLLRG